MTTQEQLQNLAEIKHQFESIDKEKIYRTNIGDLSLEKMLKPRIEDAIKKIELAINVAELVHEDMVAAIINIFHEVLGQISNITSLDHSDYANQGRSYALEMCMQLDNLKHHWVYFITAGIEKKGILDEQDIETQTQSAIDEIRQETDKTLQRVKDETENAVAKAQESAEQIENKARLTAARISVEVAQEQFGDAQEEFKIQAILWAILSAIFIAAFIGVAYYFVNNSQPNEKLGFGIIYFTTLRITILAAIGGVAAFCLRIFRANMHMRAHNLHRQRLANSMAAFVESASTSEQRDLILAHLVDAIASFGSSGLLTKSDDSMNPSKMTIDTINRTLTGTSD